jgi:hypothetical protein
MKRRLSLHSEHLAELTPNELGAIVGGPQDPKSLVCLTGVYPTINYDCTEVVERLTTAVDFSVDIC